VLAPRAANRREQRIASQEPKGTYAGYRTLTCMRTLPKDWDGTRRGLQKGIGEQLRATYEELLNEDIPTDHTDLLQRLERNEASSDVTLKR
jgi:Anti-sigma factor NepR